MSADAPRIIEIENSPGKMLRLIAMGIAMTVVSAALAFRWFPQDRPELFAEFIGYCGLAFFGLCTVMGLWRLMTTSGPVVTITPQGIRDVRIAADLIPWSAVRGISTWEYKRQKAMVLAVDRSVEAGLALTKFARWTRDANRALGADGLSVVAHGLKIDYPTLLGTCLDYWKKAKGQAVSSLLSADSDPAREKSVLANAPPPDF